MKQPCFGAGFRESDRCHYSRCCRSSGLGACCCSAACPGEAGAAAGCADAATDDSNPTSRLAVTVMPRRSRSAFGTEVINRSPLHGAEVHFVKPKITSRKITTYDETHLTVLEGREGPARKTRELVCKNPP